MKESFSDFSIVKNYIELKGKYDRDIKDIGEKQRSVEEKLKKHITALENEVKKRNNHIKILEDKLQEITQKTAEKDEQLKTLGFRLHKSKIGKVQEEPPVLEENPKKGKFGLF